MELSNEICEVNNWMKKSVVCYSLLLVAASILLGVFALEENKISKKLDIKSMAASASMVLTDETDSNKETENRLLTEIEMDIVPSSVQKTPMEIYDGMSLDERLAALNAGTLHMEYSGYYTYSGDRLSLNKGAQYYNGNKETYYSQRVLPGTSLNIPGRHVADDGTVRDGDGFICVAANPSYKPKGSVLITSVGPAKVYDSGCEYGVIDIYVNW